MVPLSRYRYATTELIASLVVGQTISYFKHIDWFDFQVVEATIEQVNRESPYNGIEITEKVTCEKVTISPWEVLYIDNRLISYPDTPETTKAKQLQLMTSIEAIKSDESYKAFLKAAQMPAFKDLAIPMSMEFYFERLSSCFYRNVHGLLYDTKLLFEVTEKCLAGEDNLKDKAKKVLMIMQKVMDIHKKTNTD